jgi:hypothetical protein
MSILAEKRRQRKEWHNAILAVIRDDSGSVDYETLYREIPNKLQLTERELRPSTEKARYEPVWRGTLRGYMTDMVQEGLLVKSGEKKNLNFSEF